MITGRMSSAVLRDVVIGTAERLEKVDTSYREMVRDPNVNIRRVKTNRSERWWIVKDEEDARAELIRRGEEYTIPHWVKDSKAS
jgi:hypothetical protein